MLSVTAGPSRNAEQEMSASQRGLIDTCFEEGQYETGIYVLDSLRSSYRKPPSVHIRQLLCLALYPPPEEETDNNPTADTNLPTSPSKLGARQQRSILIPTPAASQAALRLLEAFTSTNTSNALLRALPSHPLHWTEQSHDHAPPSYSQDDEDSAVARQSRSIQECKHCWEILREGFIRPQFDPSSSRTTSQIRRTRAGGAHTGGGEEGEEEFEQPLAVAPHAWPVLKWLISTLEKEESENERNDQHRYSTFLLCQIPPPRSAVDKRWDAGPTLEIVVFCLEEGIPQRQQLGIRLLTLLINLTATNFIDLSPFLTATFNRLQTMSKPALIFLMTMLPQTSLAIQFKLAFCRHLLVSTSSAVAKPKPKPKPKTKARPLRQTQHSTASTQPGGSQNAPEREMIPAQRYPTFRSADLLDLLGTPVAGDTKTALDTLRIRYELVLAYASLQTSADETLRDEEWPQLLSSGRLVAAVEQTFVYSGRAQSEDSRDLDMMRSILLEMVRTR
ncbi:hypothetical protein BXZ70DRAFT_1007040 [Cristinia sonorae]|uniref:Uncharacterized protein n=1 Tax=Cristinia sonorae TaxID=1940300 RepID=A0A8K0UQF4_9AGAR|nr:hypothetical protein BXZ70DRAFT_1007040 [Cristinia sonorae]